MTEQLTVCAQDIMTKGVVVLRRDAPIAEAVKLLAERGAPCAVVVDDEGAPIGIITERDLLPRAVAKGEAPPAVALRQILRDESHTLDFVREARKADAFLVAEVMSSPVQCVDAQMTVGQAATVLEAFNVRQAPVVRDGRLIGLVTRRDIVRAIATA